MIVVRPIIVGHQETGPSVPCGMGQLVGPCHVAAMVEGSILDACSGANQGFFVHPNSSKSPWLLTVSILNRRSA